MSAPAHPTDSPHGPIFLLAGQGFALGLTMAWIMIPASSLFLTAYGSELLPVTYIGAAVAGVGSSVLLAAAFRRRPLATVATRILSGLAVALLASWVVLSLAAADWVSFALLVLVPIMVPVGFIFVVGQAGLLLDVRVLKALYARVVAGFALGFVTGGLAAPPLLGFLGRTESLLAAAAAAAAAFLGLVAATRHRYPDQLSVVEHVDAGTERPTLRSLVRGRYVRLIVAFQMLSAVESQWLDFHVLESAAQRYRDSNELARFISQFSAIAYGADILFLLLVAGFLLRRFGLRYGLTANPVGVLTLVLGVVLATALLGSGATVVFVLVVAARVTDLTLSDGSSRTSLSAAYQAVPTRVRSVVQATVEGLAVPVAIGVSGVVLLVVDAVGNAGGMLLPVLTAMVVLTWAIVAVTLYRDYRVNLLANLRGRTLHAEDLTLEGESSLVAIDRLVGSANERDVRLGLDILTMAQHPELPARLRLLVDDGREGVRTDALARLAQVAPHSAADAARGALDDPSPGVRAASLRVLGAVGDPSDLVPISAARTDPAEEVRVAATFAATRVGGDAVRAEVAGEIAGLAASATPSHRVLAASMCGELPRRVEADRTVLRTLLADAEPDVVNAALGAVRGGEDAALLADVARHLDDRLTAGAAVDTLVRIGEAALVVVDEGLRGAEVSRHTQELLVRTGREVGGPAAVAVLRAHVEHRDREVGLVVMRALAALGPVGLGPGGLGPGRDGPDRGAAADPVETAVVLADLEHATHVLGVLVAFTGEDAAALLTTALRDELDLCRRRLLGALSMRHGTEGFDRVVFQLAQRDARSHALALEWLDVTLTGPERAVVAMLEPRLSDEERLHALGRSSPPAPRTQQDLLLELVQDPERRWRRPWLAACALYCAASLPAVDLDVILDGASAPARSSGADERIFVETLAGLRRRRLDLV